MPTPTSRFDDPARAPPSGDAPPGFVLVGTLDHVLEWASLVAVERPGHLEARLHVNFETRITVDGHPAPLRALRLGQPVRVVFDLVGDVALASEIVSPGA